MDDQDLCHVLSTCQVWWWCVQWFLCCRAADMDIHKHIDDTRSEQLIHAGDYTSAWIMNETVSAKLHYTDTGYGHVVQHHQRTSSQQFYNLLYTTNSPATAKNLPHPNILTYRDVGLWHCDVANLLLFGSYCRSEAVNSVVLLRKLFYPSSYSGRKQSL